MKKLIPHQIYFCSDLNQLVEFVAIETFGAMEGQAYIEIQKNGLTVGYYVNPETLEEIEEK